MLEFVVDEELKPQAPDTSQEPQEPDTEPYLSYTINGKEARLKYSMNRVDLIERVLGISIISALQGAGGEIMPKLSDLKVIFGYGLKYDDGGYLSPAQGSKIAEQMIENSEKGFVTMIQDCVLAIQRDCPFFFPAD